MSYYFSTFAIAEKLGLKGFLFDYEKLEIMLFKLLYVVLSIIIAVICIGLSKSLVKKLIKPVKLRDGTIISEKRANTLQSVLESFFKYIIYFIAAYMILSEISNSRINSVFNAIAAAAGVAVGLGAQNLIKDVIAGLFIIFEGQLSLGDMVEIESKMGIVESIGLRNIRIKAFTGEIHMIPNGSIGIVTNWQKTTAVSFIKIYVPYDENIEKVFDAINIELDMIGDNGIDGLVSRPNLLGIGDLSETNVQISISAESATAKRFSVEREIRLRIKKRFEEENIKAPYKFGGK